MSVNVIKNTSDLQIVGSVIIVAGVVIQAAYRQHFDFLDHSVISVSVFLILLGLLVTVISFCGCCGAIHEHHGLTSSYSWTLGSLFLIELGLGLLIYNLHNQVFKLGRQQLNKLTSKLWNYEKFIPGADDLLVSGGRLAGGRHGGCDEELQQGGLQGRHRHLGRAAT